MGKILGGSKSRQQSTSSSSNLAFQPIQQAFNPLLDFARQGANSFSRLLGGDTTEYDEYKKATGYDFAKERGMGAVGANFAGGRMASSGAAMKGIQEFGSNFEQQFAQNYLDKLLAQAGLGINAAQTMAQAGQVSNSQSTGTSSSGGGLLGGLMRIGSAVATSDPRLKTNIVKVDTLPNGLGLYAYDYVDGTHSFGVMADEVARIQPEALGSTFMGYKTVNYDLIKVD